MRFGTPAPPTVGTGAEGGADEDSSPPRVLKLPLRFEFADPMPKFPLLEEREGTPDDEEVRGGVGRSSRVGKPLLLGDVRDDEKEEEEEEEDEEDVEEE